MPRHITYIRYCALCRQSKARSGIYCDQCRADMAEQTRIHLQMARHSKRLSDDEMEERIEVYRKRAELFIPLFPYHQTGDEP